MPKLTGVKTLFSKKLDLSKYFPDDGNGAGYITIKKLSRQSKKIVDTVFLDSGIMQIAKKRIQETDSTEDLSSEELGKEFLKLSEEERKKSDDSIDRAYQIYSSECIDEYDHNFTDENGNKIKISMSMFEEVAEIAKYIFEEIVKFNKEDIGIGLGEQTKGK